MQLGGDYGGSPQGQIYITTSCLDDVITDVVEFTLYFVENKWPRLNIFFSNAIVFAKDRVLILLSNAILIPKWLVIE